MPRLHTSIDRRAEVEQFSQLAAHWWDERGPMAMLHKFNPVRLAYIRDQVAARISAATPSRSAACKACASSISAAAAASCRSRWRGSARRWSAPIRPRPISRWRARMRARAASAVDYRATTAEELADEGERFDVVLAMEVVEHVADVDLFVRRCAEMVKPNGLMIAATSTAPEELRARHRRRRICAALAAARHPSLGQVRDAGRTRARVRDGRACR